MSTLPPVRIFIRTKNPLNGATGNSRIAGILRSRERKAIRRRVGEEVLLTMRPHRLTWMPWLANGSLRVVICRVAPSRGLDPHDGLGAALKPVIDGIADALGLTDDRDARVRWELEQTRGRPCEYAVLIRLSSSA